MFGTYVDPSQGSPQSISLSRSVPWRGSTVDVYVPSIHNLSVPLNPFPWAASYRGSAAPRPFTYPVPRIVAYLASYEWDQHLHRTVTCVRLAIYLTLCVSTVLDLYP